ncbi:hypothetical protein [Geobacter benzoatilyticus]|uniref:Right handed beta helix domain-containing protein n=1 Tax=Geobacter benzoatilyticus TaxID=2815309 RepID=A0ABX7Q0W1_9BACT|nr:hypothetical protein [Geobacter benzoatilyticus]QSV45043.1 hypothetical protein JZM60_12915 [Geobacter benzoatilyticus]
MLFIMFDKCNSYAMQLPPNSEVALFADIKKSIKGKIYIPGGIYSKPYKIVMSNYEYILESDVYADNSAIIIETSNIILNLNNHKILYNIKSNGEGISTGSWNNKNIVIINGHIEQGPAMSEGDQYGVGNNPIRMTPYGVSKLIISDLIVSYGGKDVGGIVVSSRNSFFKNNTVVDKWQNGYFKNRHQGVNALAGAMGSSDFVNNVYIDNNIVNCRQKGIVPGNGSYVVGNKVSINSLATNSTGIAPGIGCKVYNNTIIGRGEHPIGIFYVSKAGNVEIFNNTIDVQTTKLGDEYGGNQKCLDPATPCGNYAVGFRTTWGGNNINFHDNTIIVRTDSAYKGTRTSTGEPVVVNAKGRGLMVAINAGEKSRFYNNKITVIDKDGTGKAYGIACTGGNLGEMIFDGNTVTSNILNVALGDEYGACGGSPLFYRNTFVKADNYPAYKTIASELGGYFEGTGRFVSNIFLGGASDKNINNNLAGKGRKSVHFGREMTATLQDTVASTPIAGAVVTLQNGGAPFDSTATTDALGTAKLIVYDYELHNADSTSNKILARKLAPHTMHAVIGSDTFITVLDKSPAALDLMNDVAGTFTLPLLKDGITDVGKKLTLTY